MLGVPGDHIRIHNKQVVLNGKMLSEPYVRHIFPGEDPYRDNFPNAEPRGPVYQNALAILHNNAQTAGQLLCDG